MIRVHVLTKEHLGSNSLMEEFHMSFVEIIHDGVYVEHHDNHEQQNDKDQPETHRAKNQIGGTHV